MVVGGSQRVPEDLLHSLVTRISLSSKLFFQFSRILNNLDECNKVVRIPHEVVIRKIRVARWDVVGPV